MYHFRDEAHPECRSATKRNFADPVFFLSFFLFCQESSCGWWVIRPRAARESAHARDGATSQIKSSLQTNTISVGSSYWQKLRVLNRQNKSTRNNSFLALTFNYYTSFEAMAHHFREAAPVWPQVYPYCTYCKGIQSWKNVQKTSSCSCSRSSMRWRSE